MTEWCMAHPWMTFFIVLAALDGGIRFITINVRRDKGPSRG